MKKSWSKFWHVIAVILNAIGFIAEAGEKYAETLNDDADIARQKAKRKLEKAKKKLEQAQA